MNNIDVYTLTYTHPEYLQKSLLSMMFQNVSFTGFLWDNGGSAQDIARQFGWNYASAGENVPFAAAHNRIVGHGKNEWILLLNDDAVLKPGCVKALLEHDSDVTGCLITHADGSVNHAGVEFFNGPWHGHIGRWEKPSIYRGQCRKVESVTHAVVLIRRSVWEDLEGFDEQFVWGFEDADFNLRAREKGYTVTFCGNAEVTHDELGTRTGDTNEANMERFAAKWGGRMGSVPPVVWGWGDGHPVFTFNR